MTAAAPPTIPPTMRAVRIEEHGGLDQLAVTEVDTPHPGPGEVLVEIRTAGLNHLDTWVRRGVPGHTFPLPLIPGCDGAGIVRALGPATKRAELGAEVILAPGLSCGACAACARGDDMLCSRYGILGETRDGTCAEYVVVPEANLLPKPAAIEWERAGCFALVALTAWTMVVDRARLRSGETLLVLAGGSGVGSTAIQIGKHLGCRVIATAGGDEKCQRLPEIGADAAIDHSAGPFSDRVLELTDGRGVDVVVEHVGESTWEQSLRCLAWGGRLVTCGATTGARAEIHLRRLFFKNQAILGSTMGPRGNLHTLLPLLERDRVSPILAATYPLDQLAEAHRRIEARELFGKVAINVR